MVCSNRLLNFRWEQQHCAACSAMPIVCFSFRLVWARTLLCSVSGTQIVSPSGNNAKKILGSLRWQDAVCAPASSISFVSTNSASTVPIVCGEDGGLPSAICSVAPVQGPPMSVIVTLQPSIPIHPLGPLRARFLCLCPCLSALRSWPGSQPFGSRLCAVPRPNPGRLICGHPSGACTTLQPRGTRRPLRLLSPRSGVSIHAPLDGYVQHFQDSTID